VADQESVGQEAAELEQEEGGSQIGDLSGGEEISPKKNQGELGK